MNLPLNFADPVWLWLAVPVVAIVVVGWMAASRTLPGVAWSIRFLVSRIRPRIASHCSPPGLSPC